MGFKFGSAAIGVFLIVAGFAASASAQVTYDPGSAAGKQYELPIDRARADAAPKTKAGSQSKGASSGAGAAAGATGSSATGSSPLFGAGVTAAKSSKHHQANSDSRSTSTGLPWLPIVLLLVVGSAVLAFILRRTGSAGTPRSGT
jgi:cobalamin biosynthesis Mg chelatase CobN